MGKSEWFGRQFLEVLETKVSIKMKDFEIAKSEGAR